MAFRNEISQLAHTTIKDYAEISTRRIHPRKTAPTHQILLKILKPSAVLLL
jgi:hypothetical protein